jgi:hypothetical protein
MNRRSFIKNTALAATLVGVVPSVMASDLKGGKKKKIIFVFRGVSYMDAEKAFANFKSIQDPKYWISTVYTQNPDYSHREGIKHLTENMKEKYELWHTENFDRYKINQVVPNAFDSTSKLTQIIYLHHTEIGHSSNKLYQECLNEFFAELGKVFNSDLHKVIVTADIGRNEMINSCGGRDHSNPSCLQTFVLYLGGDHSKLSTMPSHNQVLTNQF